jgi:hypothetical protein
MGYTHYWNQTRAFTVDEWAELTTDIRAITGYVENYLGVSLANGMGDPITRPEFTADVIQFNGVGDDGAHETFTIYRKRVKEWEGGSLGGAFCKTARKPYDVAVTACLCYLASVTGTHVVSSDGHGANFVDGLAAARAAVPAKANVLDIPVGVMESDRWTGPWIDGQQGSGYEVQFCVDGFGYVWQRKSKSWYRFDSHAVLAQYLDARKVVRFHNGKTGGMWGYSNTEANIWHASGSFDEARHKRIARAQAKALAPLFPADASHAFAPPAYIRPGDMPRPGETPFHYHLSDLIAACDAAPATV